ncbi:MAG TPA: tetratricopeptide repeat protein [Verrucomicrobiae bacterium]|nr:tetratricopeptide repeat protein [Verrucomicrobiae bacterium]
MRKRWYQITVSKVVVLAIVLGGVGGIISGEWPKTGIVMVIIGMIGALWDHFSSDQREKEVNDFFDAQALLLANKGIGNVYTESGKLELRKRGRTASAVKQFQKALQVDPNDKEALFSLGTAFALECAMKQWVGEHRRPDFQDKLSKAKSYAERGMRLAPDDHRFHDLLGIIHDVEGNHDRARNEFRRSGRLRSDPFWHLLMATSWGMSGHHREGLAEVRRAIAEGAQNWIVDLYYGRALCYVGDYGEAVAHLRKVLQQRKWQPQVLAHLSDAYFFQGNLGKAAGYRARRGLALLKAGRIRGIVDEGIAALFFGFHIALSLSKRLWRFSRHIPLWRNVQMKILSPAQPETSLGYKLIKAGHFELAEMHLRKACEILPDSPTLLTNLATAVALQGKKNEALEICDQAIQFARDETMLSQLQQYRIALETDTPFGRKRIVEVPSSD